MALSEARPQSDPTHLVLRGLSLGLRAQADRLRRSVPDYYVAYGVLAEARAAIELMEAILEQQLGPDTIGAAASAEDSGSDGDRFPEGVYL